MSYLRLLEYLGSLLGVLGAFLITSLVPRTRWWAFIVWLVSDLAWIVYGVSTGQYGLVGQFSVYCGTCLLGWWRIQKYFGEAARYGWKDEPIRPLGSPDSVAQKPRTSQSDPTLSSYPD